MFLLDQKGYIYTCVLLMLISCTCISSVGLSNFFRKQRAELEFIGVMIRSSDTVNLIRTEVFIDHVPPNLPLLVSTNQRAKPILESHNLRSSLLIPNRMNLCN